MKRLMLLALLVLCLRMVISAYAGVEGKNRIGQLKEQFNSFQDSRDSKAEEIRVLKEEIEVIDKNLLRLQGAYAERQAVMEEQATALRKEEDAAKTKETRKVEEVEVKEKEVLEE